MAFDIDHTAVHIDGDGFELVLSQELSELMKNQIKWPIITSKAGLSE
jgi:hypothetical protein